MTADLSPDAMAKVTGTVLEHDTAKLEQLARIAPEEQAAVVHSHLRLGIPWETALEGRTPRSSGPVPETEEAKEQRQPVPTATRRIESWPISKLKPNRFNAALFPDSLGEGSIALMAEDLAVNGQRVPVEITPDGTIVDGERRWRGAGQLAWEHVDVIVGPELSDDEMLDRVLDACVSARQMSLREQVNVYAAVCDQLKKAAGREQGRPKTMPDGIIFLTSSDIQDAAAKKAGFSSTKQAIRAEAVFTRGSVELRGQVLDASLTITAAYEALSKRPKKSTTKTPVNPEPPKRTEPESGTSIHDVPAPAPAPVTTAEETHGPGDGGHAAKADTSTTAEPQHEPAPPEGSQDAAGDALLLDFDDAVGDDDVAVHLNAVCAYLSRLAERDYDGAVVWLDDAVEQMNSSLGERPEDDEDEQRGKPLDPFDELLI